MHKLSPRDTANINHILDIAKHSKFLLKDKTSSPGLRDIRMILLSWYNPPPGSEIYYPPLLILLLLLLLLLLRTTAPTTVLPRSLRFPDSLISPVLLIFLVLHQFFLLLFLPLGRIGPRLNISTASFVGLDRLVTDGRLIFTCLSCLILRLDQSFLFAAVGFFIYALERRWLWY